MANKGYCAEYYQALSSFEEEYFWFKARNELVLHTAARFFPSAQAILDLGCGTGLTIRRLEEIYPAGFILGVDFLKESLQVASSSLRKSVLVLADVEALPFARAFDLIFILDVLEHVVDDQGALRQLALALKPNGGIVITVPQHPWLWSLHDDHSCHQRRYRAASLLKKLEMEGFRILFDTSFVSFLLPVMFLTRLSRGLAEAYGLLSRARDPIAELRIGKPLNELLRLVMHLELSVIKRGIRFPFGGSLLIAAQKCSDGLLS